MCTGHNGFNPRPNDSASDNVFINNLGAHRVGDHWVEHCDTWSCHDSVQAVGSPTVFVNNMPKARVGDQIACGSFNAQGSPNVFVGGGGSVKPGYSGHSYSEQFADTSDIEPKY
jgi:uncharacterized Zn-binding protein involved in type VI secretion